MKQSCKHCGAILGIHAHSCKCPRFVACKHCGFDIGKSHLKRGFTKYHPWCAIKVPDDFEEGIRP